MEEDLHDLETLFKEAVSEAKAPRKSPEAQARELAKAARRPFTDPTAWTSTCQVQLVHREGDRETLLGIFDEALHHTGARRLTAGVLRDMAVKVEYVTGEHWLRDFRPTSIRGEVQDNPIELVVDLVLAAGPSAPAAHTFAYQSGGAIARLVLAEATLFTGTGTFLQLPANLDVFGALSRGSKEAIWRELKSYAD